MVSFNESLVLLLFPFLTLFLVHNYVRNRGQKQLWMLALRLLIVALLVTALAGINFSLGQGGRDVLFLLDISDSISGQEKNRSIDLIKNWAQEMGVADRIGIIIFAREAFVEKPLSPVRSVAVFRSMPDRSETDLAKALKLSLDLLRDSKAPQVVLLSDGLPTRGEAIPAALDLARAGIPLNILPLGEKDELEAYLASVQVPERVRADAPFWAEVFVKSQRDTKAKVQWFVQGVLKQEKEVVVPKDRGIMVKLEDSIEIPGRYEYQVKILPEKDTRMENNQLSGQFFVISQPEILYLSSEREDIIPARVLEAQPFRMTRWNLRQGVANFQGFDLILMENTPLWQISHEMQEKIKEAVINEGTGFLLLPSSDDLSSTDSRKNPLEEILPVIMGSSAKRQKPSLALVILLDKSGSMETESKIAYARKAAASAIQWLDDGDQVGIIAFDAETTPVFPMTKKSDLLGLEEKLNLLRPSGGTRLTPAFLLASQWLQENAARQKLMLILSDGQFLKEDSKILEIGSLPQIRISTVGIEPDADRGFLEELAERHGGNSYFGRIGEEIPRFFIQEVTRRNRQITLPEATKPRFQDKHVILTGIAEDTIPVIEGYLIAESKQNSATPIEVGEGDPLLSVWQVGSGRSAILNTDLTRWGKNWLGWKDFPKLLTQLMRWVMGDRSGGEDQKERSLSERFGMREGISAELSRFGPDLEMLEKIAWLTGGKVLRNDENPFSARTGTRKEKLSLSAYLLLIALFLYLSELVLFKVNLKIKAMSNER